LMGDASAEKTDGAEGDRAVIMVAPFPDPQLFCPRANRQMNWSRSFARSSRH